MDAEAVLEETIQNINAKTLFLQEREKFLEDMANKVTYLQSALSSLKDGSLLSDERLKALKEEVCLLWPVSRKNNLELHVLESKAQDAEDRLEVVTSQVEKMKALQAQRQRDMRCTFLKFISGLFGRHLPKMFGALDSYSVGDGSTIKYYISQAL